MSVSSQSLARILLDRNIAGDRGMCARETTRGGIYPALSFNVLGRDCTLKARPWWSQREGARSVACLLIGCRLDSGTEMHWLKRVQSCLKVDDS